MPTRDWETLRQLLEDMATDVGPSRDCQAAERMLVRVSSVRGSLDRLEHGLQTAHLACCILPGVQVPAELALGLARLSAQRIGALVVIEQEQGLGEYAARGTLLDAQVSASLLETLFYPGSTLHDGAVIVRGERVLAAGVFLPLTVEHRDAVHGRLLGGRHRAALGISSATDALVFVVSEESGQIAVAHHGVLHHAVPLDTVLASNHAAAGPLTLATSAAHASRWPRLTRWWHAARRDCGPRKGPMPTE